MTYTARPAVARLGPATRTLAKAAAVAWLAVVLLLIPRAAMAQDANPLPFAESYTVTGNYVVSGVDLQPQSKGSGFVTGTIPIGGVPANADVLAAFLYWETIAPSTTLTHGAQFRGQPVRVWKASTKRLDANTAQCWTGGGTPQFVTMFRADVLRLLPMQRDEHGNATGRRLVSDADLLKQGHALNTVTLPEVGTGNRIPQSAGASLFIVYRDPSEPLTKIVLYDGLHIQKPGEKMTQTIRGFFDSATGARAKLTHIVGSGAPNATDRVLFNNGRTPAKVWTDPFKATSPSSDRSWSTQTFDVGTSMPGTDPGIGYGEQVVTSVDHTKANPYDCLAWAAVAFSTTVKDTDSDGLIDKVEEVSGLREPNGLLLPDLPKMGAKKNVKDLFIEVGYMKTAGYQGGQGDVPGHSHRPTAAALKMVGDAFWNAPDRVQVHFDVGGDYPAYTNGDAYAERYIIRGRDSRGREMARGGEAIDEKACANGPGRDCQFPDYPGTVSWKIGFQVYRDAPVGDIGQQLTPGEEDQCEALRVHKRGDTPRPGFCSAGRRRFDAGRKDVFHYGLYAHARAIPKSYDPDDADFHVPRTTSGVGDLPGGDFMVTLGFWDDFVGSDFMQASTTMHELGHNGERAHGGEVARLSDVVVGGKTLVRATIEPNCKPNYLSIMSYLFQARGLMDNAGVPHIDFAGAPPAALSETELGRASKDLENLPYRTAWYAPLVEKTLGWVLGNPAAKKLCNGAPLPSDGPAMTRIDTISTTLPINWDGRDLSPTSIGSVAGGEGSSKQDRAGRDPLSG